MSMAFDEDLDVAEVLALEGEGSLGMFGRCFMIPYSTPWIGTMSNEHLEAWVMLVFTGTWYVPQSSP